MTNNINPIFTNLSLAMDYITNTPILLANESLVAELVAKHEYHGHPDDECNYENAMRGDIECYWFTVLNVQDRYESLITRKLETPTNDPAYESIVEEMIELACKYGGDIASSEY